MERTDAIKFLKRTTLLMLSAVSAHCSQFQYDAEANCLNPKAKCNVKDTTPPTIAASTPLNGATVQQNADFQTITFSEPVNGADNPASYAFGGSGGAGISVGTVTKIDDKTYQINVVGSLVSGPVTLSFPGVSDWAGNAVSGNLSFTANVGIIVTIAPSGLPGAKYYVSNTAGGNLSISFTWQSDTVANVYYVNIVPSASSCPVSPSSSNSTGTGNTGTVATANSNITTQIKAADMAGPGDYNICVFVNKTSAPTKTGSASVVFTRDDTKPTFTSVSPASNTSLNNTMVGYNLSETCATAAITWTRTGGSADATPHTQTLTGTELSAGTFGPASITNNPTLVSGAIYSVAFNCSDYSGNPAIAVTQTNVTYDSTAPVISGISPVSNSYGNNQVSYNLSENCASGSVTWTQTGGTVDAGSPHVQSMVGAELSSGPHTNITMTNNPTLVSGSIYTLVFNCSDAANNPATSVSSTNVTFDNTPPSVPGSFVVTSVSATQLSLSWAASTDDSTPAASIVYEICRSTSATGCNTFSVTITPAAGSTSYNDTTVLGHSLYYYQIRAKDGANNTSAAAAQITGSTFMVSNFAGTGAQGNTNASAAASSFYYPMGVAMDSSGNLYVADSNNQMIRKISAGTVTTLAGTGAVGSSNGAGTLSTFNTPRGVAVDSAGNVYVADSNNHLIRKISTGGFVSTIAGTGTAGFTNGSALAATFNYPWGVAVDSSGNVYVADANNHAIRLLSGGNVTTFAGSGSPGLVNGAAASAQFNYPRAVAVDASGNVYAADDQNGAIRKITGGIVSTVVGNGLGCSEGPAASAQLYHPMAVAVDGAGNLFVGDSAQVIWQISAGYVSRMAGACFAGGSTNGPASTARFDTPSGVAVDASGNVYLGGMYNQTIRIIQ